MRKKIIATIVGISMLTTFNPVFAKATTTFKPLNNTKLEQNSTSKLSFENSNLDISKANVKLDKSKVKLNADSKKSKKEKNKSESKVSLDGSKTDSTVKSYLANTVDTTTAPAVTINDSASNAYGIEINNAYTDIMTNEGGERWYVFQNSFIQKLTAILQAPNSPNVNYELYLYKLNEENGDLNFVAGAAYGVGTENLSAIGEKGYYLLKVKSVQGFDTENPFVFKVISSDKYGANEPDDNFWQVKNYANSLSVEDTIDNDFDEDWSSLKLASDANGTLSFQNSSTKGTYQVQVYDQTLSLVATLNKNDTLNKKFPAGTYFMRVLSLSGSDPDATYKLNFVNKDSIITSATVTNIITDGGWNQNPYDRGLGVAWAVKNHMTVVGTAYNQYGKPVANQPIAAGVVCSIGNTVCQQTGYTDANGNFSIDIILRPAAGNYAFNTDISTQYYDIIKFAMVSSNGSITTNIKFLYHHAYTVVDKL